ncbi:MAG: SGNH/GDSL hydrolase family protein, partial [Myxococcota bacterium]
MSRSVILGSAAARLVAIFGAVMVGLVIPLASSQGETPPKLRLMAMGDSITMGAGDMDQGGFRRGLWEGLRRRGVDVDMVGRLRNGVGEWDLDHEGWGGRGAVWWHHRAPRVLDLHQPDLVLLMIGTNDIITMRPPAEAAARVVEL